MKKGVHIDMVNRYKESMEARSCSEWNGTDERLQGGRSISPQTCQKRLEKLHPNQGNSIQPAIVTLESPIRTWLVRKEKSGPSVEGKPKRRKKRRRKRRAEVETTVWNRSTLCIKARP